MEFHETIIVGGGQAGLAVSYYLKNEGKDHLVLEKDAQAASAWRNGRWDSFTLVTPNWSMRIPGGREIKDRYGFLPKDDIVKYFEDYISDYHLPVMYSTEVTSIEKTDKGYLIKTNQGPFKTRNVIIATGFFQKNRVPGFASGLPKNVFQVTSADYKNPDSLPDGSVLVVGSGQSGCQIAEELYLSGRKVYLSTGCTAGRIPRRYRGKDMLEWLDTMGFFYQTADQLPPGVTKFDGIPHVSGTMGGHTLNLHQFRKDGVSLLGHLKAADDNKVFITPDLQSNLMRIDQFEKNMSEVVDRFIQGSGISAPENDITYMSDGYNEPVKESINLKDENIKSVIWSGGYSFDYSMVKLPVTDKDGFPIQDHGASEYEGLYFTGIPWMPVRGTGLLFGIAEAARNIASRIMQPGKQAMHN